VAPALQKQGIAVVTSKTKVAGINNVSFDQAKSDLNQAGQAIAGIMTRMVNDNDRCVEQIVI
jgi:uncharacterized protein (UPF0261 family)